MSYLSALKNSILHPTEFYSDLNKTEPNTIKALITLLLTSSLIILTIFLGPIIYGSDLIYATFDYQTNTFIIQQLTTFQFFGYYISSNQYLLLFFDKIFFVMKMWLLFIGFIYITAWVFQENKRIRLTKTFEVIAWSSSLLIVLAGITAVFLGLRYLIPLYYHYIYYFIVVAFFFILFPSYIVLGLGKTTSLSLFRRMGLIFAPIILFFILWTVNHSEILLGRLM
jgi:hypothetical protein